MSVNNSLRLTNKGLSLIEVLIALSLIGIIFVAANFTLTDHREKIIDTANSLENAIGFANHETILKRSIVRIHFLLDKNPQQSAIEYGTDSEFVLPLFQSDQEESKLSLQELEKRDAILKKLNNQFQKVQSYQGDNFEIPENVQILGIALERRNGLIQDGEAAIYVYPNGERDAALIILAADREVIGIKIKPFMQEIDREFFQIKDVPEENLIEEYDTIANKFYKQWAID